ncbi:MAG TPA: cupin domain-containing protein [Deltaproteobacteria bacterium]|nr:cupin domain-containing protein [Deltaproteobacteria bacterium]
MKHLQITEVEGYDAPALGLEGTEKMKLRILSDDSTWIELEPGGYTPDHKHDDKERIVVMSGRGILKLGDQRKEIKPNDFIEIATEDHQFINTGKDLLAFVCFRNQR